jgi:hypothetical protein
MTVQREQLQSTILKLLARPQVDHRLGKGQHYFTEAVLNHFGPVTRDRPGGPPASANVNRSDVLEILWSLVGQGLVYVDISQAAPENWAWVLTGAGRAAAADEDANPNDPAGFLQRLKDRVPDASPTVQQYAREAVASFGSRCYLASATMLGVASEAAFLEVAAALAEWLPAGKGRDKLREVLADVRSAYVWKFTAFRNNLESRAELLPEDLRDGLTLRLNGVLELLRVYRNDAGHPTGKVISREDQFTHLALFIRYLEQLYALKRFFESAGALPAAGGVDFRPPSG